MVCILLGNGFEEAEALVPADLLRRAGVKALGGDPRVARLVHSVLDRGGYAAAICAAPTLLATFGLLEGKRAVCYPGMENEMAGAVTQTSVPFTMDGHIITGEAAGAAFPFALKLVEVLRGPEAAQRVRDGIHYHG